MTSQAAFGPPFFPPHALRRAHASLAAMFSTACATERLYEGPPLPASERAIVRADPAVSAGLPVQLRLRRWTDARSDCPRARSSSLPGKHILLVDCRVAESGSVRRFTVEAELEAGGRYRLVANATARNCEAVELIGD